MRILGRDNGKNVVEVGPGDVRHLTDADLAKLQEPEKKNHPGRKKDLVVTGITSPDEA